MKLSEAIRIGSKLRPQAFGKYFDNYINGKTGDTVSCSCALAAAFEAINGLRTYPADGDVIAFLEKTYPILGKRVSIPEHNYKGTLSGIILLLNDKKMLTREQIADIVERVENELAIS